MSTPVRKQAVTLWEMLTLFSGCGALGGAIAIGRITHLSGVRFALLMVWGVLLGVACVACARAVGRCLLERVASAGARESHFALVYAAAGLWIIVAILISVGLTSGLLGLLS